MSLNERVNGIYSVPLKTFSEIEKAEDFNTGKQILSQVRLFLIF